MLRSISSRFLLQFGAWTKPPLPEERKKERANKDGAKHWTARTDDVPGDGTTTGWNAATGQLPATFVPSAAAAAVQFTSSEQHSATTAAAAATATTTKSIPALPA